MPYTEDHAKMDPCGAANRAALDALRVAPSGEIVRRLEKLGVYDEHGNLTPQYGGEEPPDPPPVAFAVPA